MIATARPDGTYVLGDAHGDFIEPEGCGWATFRTDEEWQREVMREKKRKEREAKRRCGQ